MGRISDEKVILGRLRGGEHSCRNPLRRFRKEIAGDAD